eukprot:m.194479 g.194479  ORF g.194479 m.194479 type:complete len:222 (-) comp13660_c0_seq7:354-1019(-)
MTSTSSVAVDGGVASLHTPLTHTNNVNYPCNICHKEVRDNDRAVLCERGCQTWFHAACVGLTNDGYALLCNLKDSEWMCDVCSVKFFKKLQNNRLSKNTKRRHSDGTSSSIKKREKLKEMVSPVSKTETLTTSSTTSTSEFSKGGANSNNNNKGNTTINISTSTSTSTSTSSSVSNPTQPTAHIRNTTNTNVDNSNNNISNNTIGLSTPSPLTTTTTAHTK